jgi:soluble lytic murein transglycosylase-like protein
VDSSIQAEIVAAAQAAGVDPNLALAVANQESGGNQNAVSSAGAIGIFQLMPATAAGLGVDPHDALQNIRGGIEYLKEQLATFGDTAQALAAYNWGPMNVVHALASWGSDWLSHAPAETQNYVARITDALGGLLPSWSSLPSWLPWAGAAAGVGILLVAIW